MKHQPKPFVAALVYISVALASLAAAQVNIGGPRTLLMEPGETRTIQFTITNYGTEEVEATVFFNDYAQQGNGQLQHIPAGSLPQSLFRIASFERLGYLLGPGESAQVPMTVSVPEDAQGGYWGVIGVETPPPPPPDGGNAVGFNIRYAMVTNVEVEGVVRHELAIDNLAAIRSEGGQSVVVTVRNEGNSYQRFDVEVSFAGAGGSESAVEDRGVVLPGLTIDFQVPVPQELEPGRYAMFAVLTYQQGMRAEAVGTIEVIASEQ